MSFAEQERALFDLLFDEGLRALFLKQPEQALASYELSDDERADFASVDAFGLETDAHLRRELIMHRLCRALPLSFSIVSSRADGLARVRKLVTRDHVRATAATRTARFGDLLRSFVLSDTFASERERSMCAAIVEVERSLARAAASLRERALAGEDMREKSAVSSRTLERASEERPDDWLERPIAFAPFLCVALLPRSL